VRSGRRRSTGTFAERWYGRRSHLTTKTLASIRSVTYHLCKKTHVISIAENGHRFSLGYSSPVANSPFAILSLSALLRVK
jgi:hypothetical protein